MLDNDTTYSVSKSNPTQAIPIRINSDMLANLQRQNPETLTLSLGKTVTISQGDHTFNCTKQDITATEIYQLDNGLQLKGTPSYKLLMPPSAISEKIKKMTIESARQRKEPQTKQLDLSLPKTKRTTKSETITRKIPQEDRESPIFKALKLKLIHYLAVEKLNLEQVKKKLGKPEVVCRQLLERIARQQGDNYKLNDDWYMFLDVWGRDGTNYFENEVDREKAIRNAKKIFEIKGIKEDSEIMEYLKPIETRQRNISESSSSVASNQEQGKKKDKINIKDELKQKSANIVKENETAVVENANESKKGGEKSKSTEKESKLKLKIKMAEPVGEFIDISGKNPISKSSNESTPSEISQAVFVNSPISPANKRKAGELQGIEKKSKVDVDYTPPIKSAPELAMSEKKEIEPQLKSLVGPSKNPTNSQNGTSASKNATSQSKVLNPKEKESKLSLELVESVKKLAAKVGKSPITSPTKSHTSLKTHSKLNVPNRQPKTSKEIPTSASSSPIKTKIMKPRKWTEMSENSLSRHYLKLLEVVDKLSKHLQVQAVTMSQLDRIFVNREGITNQELMDCLGKLVKGDPVNYLKALDRDFIRYKRNLEEKNRFEKWIEQTGGTIKIL